MTVFLVVNSSLYLLIKLFLLIVLFGQCRYYLRQNRPQAEISLLTYRLSQWSTVTLDGEEQVFDDLFVLVHNPLFQLLKLKGRKKNKLIVLFNDQLPMQQLRLIHLKSANK